VAKPKKPVDPDVVRRLASLHCTIEEIAAVVGCSRDTLERRFRAQIHEGKERGKVSLRRKQWKLAMSGNATMLIWLGKQLLEQSDKIENKNSGETVVRTIREPRLPLVDH